MDSKILVAESPVSAVNLAERDGIGGLEWGGVLLLIIGIIVINLLTYNYYPNVWCDEPTFSEPAINLVKN